jgi:endonuclease/exonuclease/phosphatase (EEP) superfamily protein YafD
MVRLQAMDQPGTHHSRPGFAARLDRELARSALVWLCVGVWGAFALIRIFGLERWLLVELVAFTPWIAATAVVPIAFAAALRRWWAVGAAAVVAAALAAIVLPRAFGETTSADGEPGPTFRVLASNVGFGLASADELMTVASEREVDALIVVELTPEFDRRLRRLGVRELLPHAVLRAEPKARGSGIYTSLPVQSFSRDRLPGGLVMPSARVLPAGAPAFDLVGVHTAPPTAGTDAWTGDLEALPAADATTPTILAGDFNATVDHEAFRDLLDRGYADVAETLGQGLTPTWPTGRRLPPLVTIDHVLADERLGIREFSAHEITGTDHRAVFAELELPAG